MLACLYHEKVIGLSLLQRRNCRWFAIDWREGGSSPRYHQYRAACSVDSWQERWFDEFELGQLIHTYPEMSKLMTWFFIFAGLRQSKVYFCSQSWTISWFGQTFNFWIHPSKLEEQLLPLGIDDNCAYFHVYRTGNHSFSLVRFVPQKVELLQQERSFASGRRGCCQTRRCFARN